MDVVFISCVVIIINKHCPSSCLDVICLVTRIMVVLMPHYVELGLGCGNIPDISIGGDGFKQTF